ncbi:hypothetical protein BJV82DRAFT_574381 [Fennellomyces sp. T-0311]|nr:hypothetical protein BJV82DRAFT_574381 [Fennellomyces sp. T-0311]
MSGHVVYSCACLNIKLHLANKYLWDNHDNDRAECFVRLSDPPLEGRQFDLGMGGVQAEYNSLMTTRLVGKDRSWMTVACLNCSTGDVYSVRRPSNERGFTITYPVDVHSLYSTGDRVVIHDNTVFGDQIEAIKQRQNYSHNFGIVLNVDAPAGKKSDGFEGKSTIPGDLYSQHGQLKLILEQSLKQMQLDTEARIEQFRQDQLEELERSSTQAKCDRDFLWQRILEASRTVNEEQQLRKRLSSESDHGSDSEPSHVRFAEEKQASRSDTPIRQQAPQPSTSSYITPSSLRKASFALDERVIATSWKNSTHNPQIKPTTSEGLAREDNGDSDDIALSDQEDSDGLFDLDEEIDDDSSAHEDAESSDKKDISGSYRGSADWRRKRPSTKYLSTYDEADEENDSRPQSSGNDLLSTSVSAYATSVPIAISHSDINEAMKELPNENAVNPADQDPTKTGSSIQKNNAESSKEVPLSTSKGVIQYDQFSYADQEISKLFPQDRRRKSIASTGTTPRPQLDSLVGQSLDTRRRIARTPIMRNTDQQKLSYYETGSGDEHEGPMVPPHILAANTYTDETEELFGAVPRSNTWRKTYD